MRQHAKRWYLVDDPFRKIGHLRWFDCTSKNWLPDSPELKIEKMTNTGELICHLPMWLRRVLWTPCGRDPVRGRFIRYHAPRIMYAAIVDGLLSGVLGYGQMLHVFMRKTGE